MSLMQMTKETKSLQKETFESVLSASQKTEQESLTFVKKLLTVGLSSITYLRNVLPEEAYSNTNMEGLQLKILNENSDCPAGRLLVNYINACFEALEKKYLRRLTLNFENSHAPEKVVEAFTFSFSYPESGEYTVDELKGENFSSTNRHHSFNVKKPTIKMLRTVILLSQALAPLPDNIQLTLDLQYYENVTPSNYEPKGFVPSNDPLAFEAETVNIKVGKVMTKYHVVDLKCKTTSLNQTGEEESSKEEELDTIDDTQRGEIDERQQLDEDIFCNTPENNEDPILGAPPSNSIHDVNTSAVVPENYFTIESVIKSLGEKDLLQICPDSHFEEDGNMEQSTPQNSTLSTPYQGSATIRTGSACSVTRGSQSSESQSSNIEYLIRCPCGIAFDQGIMILCDVCNYWQHGPCFNIITDQQAPARHICEKCADPPSCCTDPRLTSTNLPLVSAACLYRRTLVVLEELKYSHINHLVLMKYLGINESLASGLILRTTREGITKQKINSEDLILNKEKLLGEAFPKYLRTPNCLRTPKYKKTPKYSRCPDKQTTQDHVCSNITKSDIPICDEHEAEISEFEGFQSCDDNKLSKKKLKKIRSTQEVDVTKKSSCEQKIHFSCESRILHRKRKYIPDDKENMSPESSQDKPSQKSTSEIAFDLLLTSC